MNDIDDTDRRTGEESDVEPPSLLTIILDTNPHAWSLLANDLPLSKAVASVLVFVNAHLAINPANRVAVLASHASRAEWLFPTPKLGDGASSHKSNGTTGPDAGISQASDDANKYRTFAHVEHAVATSLRRLMASTETSDLESISTMMAGALTKALTYTSKASAAAPTATQSAQFSFGSANSAAGGNELSANNTTLSGGRQGLVSRILILSVSGDLASQYIPIMNSIFACQRLSIPIDILKLAGDTVFLQQAADATGGIYLPIDSPLARKGLLQYLMFAYLPDATARQHLITPGEGEGVDFRAACFCHRNIIDIGFVCSICLSIFCHPLEDQTCLTCGSYLSMGNYGQKPAVVPRRKKKKKRLADGAVDTPTPGGSGPGTPAG
ncbi:transcription factor Tfb4 [Polychaeton citri CBS 116435]|uniref:General transcription and DNA repair factor IIH subunit TFB4 n=1 Tax=Polychaeton citri CBS 116435 TaxID=1314669 RepID=A0A9P4UKK3_9PEZI|nr:transcription factor Tfb4 [Polychaeton citri CBS 116435]